MESRPTGLPAARTGLGDRWVLAGGGNIGPLLRPISPKSDLDVSFGLLTTNALPPRPPNELCGVIPGVRFCPELDGLRSSATSTPLPSEPSSSENPLSLSDSGTAGTEAADLDGFETKSGGSGASSGESKMLDLCFSDVLGGVETGDRGGDPTSLIADLGVAGVARKSGGRGASSAGFAFGVAVKSGGSGASSTLIGDRRPVSRVPVDDEESPVG